MAKVYIPNRGAHDYSSAEKFGDLIFCTDGLVDRYDTSQMYRELSDAMKDSSADDFIVITSLASLCSVACAIFAAKHGRLNLLLHRSDGYMSRVLILDNETTLSHAKRLLRKTDH